MAELPNCTSIKVDDTHPNEVLNKEVTIDLFDKRRDQYTKEYIIQHKFGSFYKNGKFHGPNTYLEFIMNYPLFKKIQPYCESRMPSQGITEKDISILTSWIHKQKSIPLLAVFDWDQTITVMNGCEIPRDDELKLIKIYQRHVNFEDHIEYLLGGKKRANMIRAMFSILRENNVYVFISTRNGLAVHSRKGFTKLIQMIDPSFTEDFLIFTTQNESKAASLLAFPKYKEIMKQIQTACLTQRKTQRKMQRKTQRKMQRKKKSKKQTRRAKS